MEVLKELEILANSENDEVRRLVQIVSVIRDEVDVALADLVRHIGSTRESLADVEFKVKRLEK